VKTNLFDSSSLYYVLRSREQHRIKPILDSRLSLRVYADKTGLKIYNDPADPMPLNISGGKTLDECKVEETEDYIIYADGGTQTRMGRKGLAQKYIEALNTIYSEEIEKGSNILSPKHLTSEVQFHSDLLDILNDEHNKEIEAAYEAQLKVKNTLTDEPYLEPLSEQRVFVSINFACRIDKKTGEFYIGEGYENIVSTTVNGGIEIQKIQDGLFKLVATRTSYSSVVWYRGLESNTNYSYYWNTVKNVGNFLRVRTPDNTFVNSFYSTNSLGEITMRTVETKPQFDLVYELEEGEIGREVEVKMQLTKTSTPKPFVKSVMPNGKLAFVTNATSETHSFVMKGVNVPNSSTKDHFYFCSDRFGVVYEYCDVTGASGKDGLSYMVSKDAVLSNVLGVTPRVFVKGVSGGVFSIRPTTNSDYKQFSQSFTQLLIYKGNFTETELKAENGKLDFIQFEL
ncbi:MAG: hypothetical protein ACRC92_18135, partial [Peptostreptococcaceae bacterium]